MADINIERKRRSAWPWLLALLLILVLAAGAWWYLRQPAGARNAAVLGGDTTPPAATAPAYDPATAPPYPANQGDTAQPPDTTAH